MNGPIQRRGPKNPVVQRRLHKKGIVQPQRQPQQIERPSNAVVMYFVGRSDGKYVKLGIAEDVNNAWKRLDAHSKEVIQIGLHYVFLTAAWALRKDEDYLKSLWSSKMDIPGATELAVADEEVRGFIRFLRKKQHSAQRDFNDLPHLSYVPFENWAPGDGHYYPEEEEEPWQHEMFDHGKEISLPPEPFDDVLRCIYHPENDYFTPECLIEAAKETFSGVIDLDPASCEWAQYGDSTHKGVSAEFFFCPPSEDGGRKSWRVYPHRGARVFLNPPFNEWKIWGPKIVAEFESGNASEVIVYCTFQSATTKTFNQVLSRASATLITNGRINCWGPLAKSSNGDGNLIAYLGPHPDRFCKAFSPYGPVQYGQAYVESLIQRVHNMLPIEPSQPLEVEEIRKNGRLF